MACFVPQLWWFAKVSFRSPIYFSNEVKTLPPRRYISICLCFPYYFAYFAMHSNNDVHNTRMIILLSLLQVSFFLPLSSLSTYSTVNPIKLSEVILPSAISIAAQKLVPHNLHTLNNTFPNDQKTPLSSKPWHGVGWLLGFFFSFFLSFSNFFGYF